MKDYIIVGFGLAGMAIANELQKRNKSFLVYDQGEQNASKVAGGMTNPLILKRFTKAWKADQFIPKAETTYQDLEEVLKLKIFKQIPIYRKINSVREQNDWFHASDKKELHPFMDDKLHQLDEIEGPYNFGKVIHSSLLDTEKLLSGFQKHLLDKKQFISENFEYNKIDYSKDLIRYKNIQTKKVIFCEGIGLYKNPYFKDLPLVGNKGEFLVLKIPNIKLDVIVKTALALVPLGNDYYKFGATYSRDYENLKPEKESKEFLINKLEEIIDVPYQVIDTEVGIRPTVIDRRPLLGKHPKYPNFLICNGLGSHGIMMAPTMADWLLNFDLNNKFLPKTVNVNRHMPV